MAFLKALFITLVAVFAPIQGIVLTTFILILADLFFGVWAAKKRGEPITSAALRRTVSKFFVYESVIAVSYLGEHYLLDGLMPVTKLVAGVIGMVELTSVLENVQGATGLDLGHVIRLLGSKNDKDPPKGN